MNGHNGTKLNGKKHNGHNGHKLNGKHNGKLNGKHNGHNGHKLEGADETVHPIKIDSEIVAVLMELKYIREMGHSSLCQCHTCHDLIPRALKAGLTRAVYADVFKLTPEEYLEATTADFT